MSSELHDATFRILCEKNYGPINMGTVLIAQKGIMISILWQEEYILYKIHVIILYMIQ